jgi:sugar phosphate isomerase/epimerase
MTANITPRSLELFLGYARDACNWNGTPLVGGNVGGAPGDRGNLTQLKKAGLIETWSDEGCTWVEFTEAGQALAESHGITINQ